MVTLSTKPRLHSFVRCTSCAFSFAALALALLVITVAASPVQADDLITRATPGGRTLQQRAIDAYRTGDFAASAELFARYLEAQPSDPSSWYNYACSLALAGRKGAALTALKGAIDLGFDHLSQMTDDPDLNSLRELPKYGTLLKRLEKRAEANAGNVQRSHFYREERLGRYQLYLPEGYNPETGSDPLPVVLFLHGRTQLPADMEYVATRIVKEGFAVILPEAPYQVAGFRRGFEYWPTDPAATSPLEGRQVYLVARDATIANLRVILDDAAKQFPLDREHVILSGFSQGAATVFSTILSDPDPYFAAAPIGSSLPPSNTKEKLFSGFAANGSHLLVLNGSEDRPEGAQEAAHVARDAGVKDVQIKIYEGIPHRLTPEMVKDLAIWASGIVRPD